MNPQNSIGNYLGVSENRGPEYNSQNSRILMIRTLKHGTPSFRKLPFRPLHYPAFAPESEVFGVTRKSLRGYMQHIGDLYLSLFLSLCLSLSLSLYIYIYIYENTYIHIYVYVYFLALYDVILYKGISLYNTKNI